MGHPTAPLCLPASHILATALHPSYHSSNYDATVCEEKIISQKQHQHMLNWAVHADFQHMCSIHQHVLFFSTCVEISSTCCFAAHVLKYPAHADLSCTCCFSAHVLNLTACRFFITRAEVSAQLIYRKPTQQQNQDDWNICPLFVKVAQPEAARGWNWNQDPIDWQSTMLTRS